MATRHVRIDDITVDLAIHFRDTVNQGAVARYRECLDNLPAIKLVQVEDQLLLASGLHRYHAHRDAGREEIEAETLEGTRNDAIVIGLKDNSLHGVPLSRKERNRAISQLVKMDLTYVEISEIFGLHETTVNKIANAEGTRKRPKSIGEKGHLTRQTAAKPEQNFSAADFVADINDDGEINTSLTETGLPESQETVGSGATVEAASNPEEAVPAEPSPMTRFNVDLGQKFVIALLPAQWVALVTNAEGNPSFCEDELAVAGVQLVKARFAKFGIPWERVDDATLEDIDPLPPTDEKTATEEGGLPDQHVEATEGAP